MGARTAQVGVTKGTRSWVLLNGRIQIADTWAMNAGAIVELEAVSPVKLILNAEVGHPVAEVAVIVLLLAIGELGVQATVLIAQALASGPVALAEGVAHIGCCHMSAVIKQGDVIHLGHSHELKGSLTLVQAVDVLDTCLKLVIFGKRPCPVKLESVLSKVLFSVVGLSGVREWSVDHIAEG